MGISLKDMNRPMLVTVVIANVAVYYMILIWTFDTQSFTNMISGVETFAPGALMALIVGVLNSQLSHDMKARLVFWRWHHPLPGSYAFTKVMDTDTRIDPKALQNFTNPLPKEPAEQNRLWFKWYREFKDDAAIRQVHREYLLARDWAGIAFLFLLSMTPIAFWQMEPQRVSVLVLFLVAQFLIVRQSAKNHGERFVASVLAYKSTSSLPPSAGSRENR